MLVLGQYFRAPQRVDTAPTGPDTNRNRVRREPLAQGTGRMVGVEVLFKCEGETSLVLTKLWKMLGRSRYKVRGWSW